MKSILQTQRLTLREASKDDVRFILELMNERGYIANIGDRGVRTIEDAGAYLEAKYTANYHSLGYGLYVVETKTDGIAVGVCGFVKREMLEHANIGFAYLERFWSRGYGYEAAAAVVEYGRTVLGFPRVFGVTSRLNHGSIRILEKLGLTYQQSISLPGYAEESLLFSKSFPPP